MNRTDCDYCRCRHARIHLPALDAGEAVIVVTVLQKVVDAIWGVHGEEMREYQEYLEPGSMPRPAGAVWCGDRDREGDEVDF